MDKVERNKSFIFIGDIIKTRLDLPIEIIPKHFLKKASSNRIPTIDKFIEPVFKVSTMYLNKHKLKILPKKVDIFKLHISADPKDWNYWIIEHDEKFANKNLALALRLAEVDLNIIMEYNYLGKIDNTLIDEYRVYRHMLYPFVYYTDTCLDLDFKRFLEKDIAEIRDIFRLIEEFSTIKNDYAFIEVSLSEFSKLKNMSRDSIFKIVGLFSIFELMLTHQSVSRDDSISRQLQKKIVLLNNRFEKKIDFFKYFARSDALTESTIIKKMYTYRSQIAHGAPVDFKHDLKILKGHKQVYNFLYMFLKKILIHSLREPQLVKDLKEC